MATLKLYGMLPRHTGRIYQRFTGWVGLKATFETFVNTGKKSGLLIDGRMKQHMKESPVLVSRIRTSYSFA